jgi:hypothetical protein
MLLIEKYANPEIKSIVINLDFRLLPFVINYPTYDEFSGRLVKIMYYIDNGVGEELCVLEELKYDVFRHQAASLGMVVNHQAASCDQLVIDQAAFANQEEGEQYYLFSILFYSIFIVAVACSFYHFFFYDLKQKFSDDLDKKQNARMQKAYDENVDATRLYLRQKAIRHYAS